jgi:hypothetical protein
MNSGHESPYCYLCGNKKVTSGNKTAGKSLVTFPLRGKWER